MFNDDVQMGFFDIYDQYLLNILYDPRIRPGMSRDEVKAILPDVLASTRAWVNDTNPPRRTGSAANRVDPDSRSKISVSANGFVPTTTNIR
jgi:hypothetical protein